MNARLPPVQKTALVLVLEMALALAANAQTPAPAPWPGAAVNQSTAASTSLHASAAQQAIAKIRVSADAAPLIADGLSPLRFSVQVLDVSGLPLPEGSVTVQADAGARLADTGAAQMGPLTLAVRNGVASFVLLAPPTPGDVHLQISAGRVQAQTVLNYAPHLREMLAIGVIEGIISKSHLQAGSITPTRFNDGFEQEIVRWSRDLGDETTAAARTAFYLKGKISGDVLLTAAYDSDKDTRLKLAQTIDPQAVYPVYGDNSTSSLDARSGDRLYVRLDKDRSYLLYGDFSSTGALQGNGQALQAGASPEPEAVLLGRYNRTATGLRGHYEASGWQADSFVISDTLKQAVEEYPANGTSGPYAVANNNAVQDSERVEVVVRDRNQRGVIKSITTLMRYVDYSFEPFSGRIVLTLPLPSLTPQGDPTSLRISYEVDQGGPQFLAYGVAGSVALPTSPAQPAVRLGASAVTDENPLAPYQLDSINADVRLGESLHLVLEAAQSQSTQNSANGSLYPLATGLTGEVGKELQGQAQRLDLAYQTPALSARLWWMQTDANFSNTSAGVSPSRVDAGARARKPLSDTLTGYAEYQQTEDTLSNLGRYAGGVGVVQQATPELSIDWSLHSIHDNAGFAADAQIAGNAQGLGTAGSSTGGFYGTGTSNTVIDPATGAPISTLASTGSTPGVRPGTPLEATTARVGFVWQRTPEWQVNGAVESSINGQAQDRLELGTVYTLTPTDRLYARVESQTGLAAPTSLNYADRSHALSAGLTHAASADTTLFSEYRLVDASSDNSPATYDQMLANGLHNRQHIRDGLVANTSAEYLSVLSGNQRQALALTGALDWTLDPRSRAGAKLEYRRLFDANSMPGDQTQDQWLSTLSYARKLDSDWTLLVKNYYLYQENHDDATGHPLGNTQQERLITGFAWRPTAHNQFNALARYEYKAVDDHAQVLGDQYAAHIGSVLVDYHPRRAWWGSARVAAKSSSDYTVSSSDQTFNAWLAGLRLTWDMGDALDVGVLASTLRQSGNTAAQDAFGVEAGYQVKKNLWISVGYNWSGYYDRDLSGSDYTQQGAYLRLRAKFDESSLPR